VVCECVCETKVGNKQGSPHNPVRVPDFLHKKPSSEEEVLSVVIIPSRPFFDKWETKGNEMMTVEERIFVEIYENVLRNDKFKMYTERSINLGRKIMDLLGDKSLLFLEYERCTCLAEGIYLEDTYQAGLGDGMNKYSEACQTKCQTEY
jgi:hypothetical protein